MSAPLLAAIETGGTKVNVAVGYDPLAPLARTRLATRHPDETIPAIIAFIRDAARDHGPVAAIGLGSFGPLDFAAGAVAPTTKPGWSNAPVVAPLAAAFGCPIGFDTDVNAAALGEARWGAGRGLDSLVYLTVGTGIGGGAIVAGRPVHGLLHPEMGHMLVRRHSDDDYPGICAFHGDCAEGLASGPAIAARFGVGLDELPADHPFRAILADYLGQLCALIVGALSPHRIVIGGGVMNAGGLHAPVEAEMRRRLASYIGPLAGAGGGYVVPPGRGDDAGIAGGFALAIDALAAARL